MGGKSSTQSVFLEKLKCGNHAGGGLVHHSLKKFPGKTIQEAQQPCNIFRQRWIKNDSEMKWLKISEKA